MMKKPAGTEKYTRAEIDLARELCTKLEKRLRVIQRLPRRRLGFDDEETYPHVRVQWCELARYVLRQFDRKTK